VSETDNQPTSEIPRPRPPRRVGLSGKLLLLTIPLVMIAGMLIYVPAIANFRMNRLNDRLAAANTAYESFNKVAKQATEIAEANFAAATSVAKESKKQRAAA